MSRTSGLARSSHHVTFSSLAFSELTFQVAIRMVYSADFTIRPFASTYHFSLANVLPWSVAAIQSAIRIGGKGPQVGEGRVTAGGRESWWAAESFRSLCRLRTTP